VSLRIEICGVTGSGKTTLAKALQLEFAPHLEVVLENYKEIPFWEECWLRPGEFEFERDLGFLLHQFGLIKLCPAGKNIICDFAFFQNRAYAKLSNDAGDNALFDSIYHRLSNRLSVPTAIINIVCKPDVLIERIMKRNRDQEASISSKYLISFSKSIESELYKLQSESKVNIFTINNDLDNRLPTNDSRFKAISTEIARLLRSDVL